MGNSPYIIKNIFKIFASEHGTNTIKQYRKTELFLVPLESDILESPIFNTRRMGKEAIRLKARHTFASIMPTARGQKG